MREVARGSEPASLKALLEGPEADESLNVEAAFPRNVQLARIFLCDKLNLILPVAGGLGCAENLLKICVGNENRRTAVIQQQA